MTDPYPHLGFDPAPGSTVVVALLEERLRTAAGKLSEADQLVRRLRDSTSWQGDAAVAFREELDGVLPRNLGDAHTSLRKAAAQLRRWGTSLGDFQTTAARLDGEARAARQRLADAHHNWQLAKDNPDLGLAHMTFTDMDVLADAQGRLDVATGELHRAVSAVESAQADLEAILRRARDLAQEHEATARDHARAIREATDGLAPEEPSWFTKALEWLKDNLTDVLGLTAAVLGLLALLVTGPVGAALLLCAATTSVAAMTSRISDPKVRAALRDGFTKGEFDSDFWAAAVGLLGDSLGSVPVIGAVARGVNGAVRAANALGKSLGLSEALASAGSKAWLAATRIHRSANPVTTLLVKGSANPAAAAKNLDATVAGAGVATAGYGAAKNLWDPIKHPAVEDTGTTVDAARAVPFDSAGHGNTVLKTLKVLLHAR